MVDVCNIGWTIPERCQFNMNIDNKGMFVILKS